MLLRIGCLSAFLALVVAILLPAAASGQLDAPGAASADASTAAAPPTASPAAAPPDVKYFDFFVVKGGPIAYGLILLSVVMVALTIEHGLTIRRITIVPPEAARHTRELIDKKKYLEAIRFTGDDPSMLCSVLNACLLEAGNGFPAMQRALEDTLDERSARLLRKTQYLNIIGNVAPMIGLLGTVTGMILLFSQIHAADAFPGARIVADKIAVALITTFWGLAVAIPALSIYAIFRNRIDVLTAECALATEHLLSVFKPGTAAPPAAAATATDSAAANPAAPPHKPTGAHHAPPS